jgi:hypothetical protein
MKPIIIVVLILLALVGALLYARTIVPRIKAAPTLTLSIPVQNMVAGVAAVPVKGQFNESGTIVLDTSNGLPGTPYLLFTRYAETGKASVMTKRLVFPGRDECAKRNLPCATAQPGFPVVAEEEVRIVGEVNDDTIVVYEVIREE